MEAICHPTGPAVCAPVGSTSNKKQSSLASAAVDCGSKSGGLVPALSCRSNALLLRSGAAKRNVRVWSLEFRSEASAGIEETVSAQADSVDRTRRSLEEAVNGVHPTSVNGLSVAGNTANEENLNGDFVNGTSNGVAYNGVTHYVVSTAVPSFNNASQNGSANGTSVDATSHNVSVNGAIINGVASKRANGVAVNGVTVNGAALRGSGVNGTLGMSAVNGTAIRKIEPKRPIVMPSQVPGPPLEEDEGFSELPKDLKANGRPLTRPIAVGSTPAVIDLTKLNGNGAATTTLPRTTIETFGSPVQEGLGILKFLKGKHILVTGATGFLAKVLVEKILRVQPDVGQLYLLIQPHSNATAEQRLHSKVINSPLFKLLRSQHEGDYEKFMKEKLTAVDGTISVDGLGLESNLAKELASTVDVIVSSAATTAFDERYDVALNINTQGPKRLLDFGKRCPNLQLFLHVSTAFVNGQRQGRTPEKPFRMGESISKEMLGEEAVPELSVATELSLAEKELSDIEANVGNCGSLKEDAGRKLIDKKMMDLGLKRAQLFGWQDTYVFSKAMGEMLLNEHREDVPVVVLRPSVVESTFAEPFSGWMEGIRMMDPIVLAYGKGQMTGFLVDPRGVLDVVPADMVVNAILAAMAKHAQHPGLSVYQVASSVVNPLIMDTLADVMLDHFTKDPMLDRAGKPIKVKRMCLLQNMQAFLLYMWFNYQLPIQLFKFIPWQKSGRMTEKRNQILLKTLEQFNYLAGIYKPYTFYGGRFDVVNTERLSKELSADELERFGFNVRAIDWSNYLHNIHFPGLRQYVLKGRGTKN